MRRLLALAIALPALLAATPADAAVRFNLGTTRLTVTEWDNSTHGVTVPLDGWWARPPARFRGRRPVVMLLHGSYPVCTTSRGPISDDYLPCGPGVRQIDNSRGLVYLVDALAEAGYVAVSVDANTAFGMDNHVRFDDGFESTSSGAFSTRARVVDAVLRRIATASQGGTFAGRSLVGRVDLTHVGVVGHSRGGEGAIYGAADGTFAAGPYRLAALLAIAPTNFQEVTPPDVPFAVLAGYCDGDVYNLGGLMNYDLATRNPARTTPAYAQVLLGANHNFFDTVWTSTDEAFPTSYCRHGAIGRSRITARQQRSAAIRFVRAFVRRHLSNGSAAAVLATGGPAPRSLAGSQVITSYQPGADRRRVVDLPAAVGTNAFGSAVSGAALGSLELIPPDLLHQPTAPWSPNRLRVRTLGTNGRLVETLPGAAGDVHGYRSLSFRAAVDPRVAPARGRRVTVTLVDRTGKRSSVTLPSESALRTPPASRGGKKGLLGTVRVRLNRFAVDRAHVTRVELRFPGAGRVFVADVAFER